MRAARRTRALLLPRARACAGNVETFQLLDFTLPDAFNAARNAQTQAAQQLAVRGREHALRRCVCASVCVCVSVHVCMHTRLFCFLVWRAQQPLRFAMYRLPVAWRSG